MKTALVLTKVGANPEIISGGENGFLVPTRNAPELATALKKLIEDEDLRVKMGISNRRKVEANFQWSQTVDKIEKVYSQIA
jgi:glycosyltransferase involved in cell wall biosynthesis